MSKDRKTRRRIPFVPNTLKLLLLVFLVFALIVVFRHGYIPARYSPFATISLDDPSGVFLDWRIAQLAEDKATCRRILRKPHISATPVKDRGQYPGCGRYNAFRVSQAGGITLSPALTMECPLAAGLSLWLKHAVQPAAKRHFGQHIASVRHVGGYSCRNIRGGLGKIFALRSEHARSNAIDITSFRLVNGKNINIRKDWSRRESAKGRFLREIHAEACGYFRVTLGPEANALHADHFHLDRGPLRSCR